MCVILHALKKRHVTKEEILQAMKSNDAGFFAMGIKPGGDKAYIRTLDEKAVVDFYDREVGDDDQFVMHARIPSRGQKSIDNVHGWEEDGVFFCHNMTLSELDEVMGDEKWEGTDSEFFFRRVFMPFYRALGKDAYAGGKLAEPLDRLVRIAVQRSNKFLFVMPDGKVLRYGTWVSEADRKEGGEVAFWASNSSYKVYKRTWGAASRTPSYPSYPPYPSCCIDDDDDDAYPGPDRGPSWNVRGPQAGVEFDGSMLASAVGFAYLARTGFKAFVLTQAVALRRLAEAETTACGARGDAAVKAFDRTAGDLYGLVFSRYDGKNDPGLAEACDPNTTILPTGVEASSGRHIEAYVGEWACELERFLETRRGKVPRLAVHVAGSLLVELAEEFEARLDSVLMMFNCCINTAAEKLADAISMFVPGIGKKSRFAMEKARLVDLVVPDDEDTDTAMATATALFGKVREYELDEELGTGDDVPAAGAPAGKEK